MNNPELSLAFYHYLCDVIGTEDDVNMRRHIFTTLDNVASARCETYISSGSKAEGLDLDGSDFDLMLICNNFPVYENKDTVKPYFVTFPFIMDTSDCKPGFTQLKQYDSFNLVDVCEYKRGVGYLSSTKFRNKNAGKSSITHGPCNSILDGAIDVAVCLRCATWISQAKPWILRSRNLLASNNVINSIVNLGVLFVPIGCKNSPNTDFEWRISFSYAEKLLIWSFNHVQLLCYALMKILLKDIIKSTTGDLLCSYFLKTVMFWVCEETKSSQWKPNNILLCFMSCFDRLIFCVRYKTCAHYFIQENDLFADRFDRQQHSLLLSTLKQLRNLEWKCLLQTKTLGTFREFLQPTTLSLMYKVSYYPSLCLLDIFSAKYNFRCLNQGVYYCMRANKKDVYIYMISILNMYISQTLSLCGDNKQLYNINRKRLCHLLMNLNHDSVSGWLLLASHCYVNKQYNICKYIISQCLLRCTPDKCLLSRNPANRSSITLNLPHRIRQGILPLQVITKCVIHNITFAPLSQILPKEIAEIYKGQCIHISPVVFAVFLKFLCNHHLRNQMEKDESLQELEVVVQNKYFILNHVLPEQARTLLSIAYSMSD